MAESSPESSPKSSSSAAKNLKPRLPVASQLSAISSVSRWLILNELMKEPLPVCAIAAALRVSETSISKHMAVLLSVGIVHRHYGLYRIDSRFLVPGERSLDFGSVLIRFDPPG
jgi:DNA-binding transcriptional ArsR family regulator